ncbi:hypothetical protein RDV84_00170 [Lysobacter yananisis]|uniref:Major tail protein n=1 Tax=Lysobacter yananisis TaxID=1003114 RepID=A0ABY9P8A3_9GAMM|nr:hypothetical protein [Lysobacter yananisis]WMT03305.1 hypothetical protein RDV84_00170 [Lysobacter yananisis]
MADITEYFSMQGRVYLGLRNADGSRQPARWVYDSSTLNWAMTSERAEKTESNTGVRGVAATMKTSRSMAVNLTLGQLNTDNLALATDGTRIEVAAGTVTNEVLGSVKAGDVIALDYAVVSDLALVDGTAAPLVAGTDYELNPKTGILQFFTTKAGVKASTYDYGAHSIVTAMSALSRDYYVLFDGLNSVDGAEMVCRGEVHRVSFSPAGELGFIQDEFGQIELEGQAKSDPFRQRDPKWGPFARAMLIG